MSSEQQELYEKMEEVLKQAPESRHSYFQMKYFVIGKEPTTQAQMWQCLRELQSRKATIDSLNLSIAETKDQIELQDIEQAKEFYNLDSNAMTIFLKDLGEREKVIRGRQYERKKHQLQLSLTQLEESLRFAWQEANFFLQMFEAIRRVEPLKNYDDLAAQEEYWNERIGQQINLKLLLQQPLDTELVNTALSLHENAPIRVQTQKTLDHIREQMNQLKEQYLQKIGTKENNGETQDQFRQRVSAGRSECVSTSH